jgi:predicted SAM-dependent methyltransferase
MKLHLGCGSKKIPGYINIDIVENECVDEVADIRFLSGYDENSVDVIYACHVLEHISRVEYKDVLKRWHRVLKPGGILRVSIPDLEKWFSYCLENDNFRLMLGALYGQQNNDYNLHRMGWTEKTIKEDLLEIGFSRVLNYDCNKTEHSHIRDWSRDFLPYCDSNGNQLPDEEWYKGTLVSANIEATK